MEKVAYKEVTAIVRRTRNLTPRSAAQVTMNKQ